MIDLKQEQAATLARPRWRYSFLARFFFFFSMDLVTGKETTFAKTKLIEMLATIPYRRWEIRQYHRMTRKYQDAAAVRRALAVCGWGREAQDNEYWHLLIIEEKMRQEGLKDPWYLWWPVAWCILTGYILLSYLLALFAIRKAFMLNAQFEDHAEHTYAQFVADHPEWDGQPVNWEKIKEYDATVETWGDVFRRIGLDERDHMNHSLIFAGRPEDVVAYEGMPGADPGVDQPPPPTPEEWRAKQAAAADPADAAVPGEPEGPAKEPAADVPVQENEVVDGVPDPDGPPPAEDEAKDG